MPILLNNAVDKAVATFDLRTPQAIAEDSGTITGAPTYSKAGINLDGSSDYVTYAIPNTLLSHAKISIVIEFTPDFEADDSANHTLIDSSENSRYNFVKDSTNQLNITLGNTSVEALALGVYSAYWKVNERNVLVVSGDATNNVTNVWLNGTLILDEDSTAWGVKYPVIFTVGSRFSGVNLFDGEIHSISIHNTLLTGDEASDLYTNSLFNFENKADVWLDMASQVGKESGTELIVGGMTYGGWTPANNAILTNPTADVLRVAYDDTTNPNAAQTILTGAKRFRITGQARGDGTYAPAFTSSGANSHWTGTTSTDWQEFDVIITADFANLRLLAAATGAGYAEFRNVSAELIEQTTPCKKGNDFLLGDGNDTTLYPTFKNKGFDFDGSDDYMSNPNATGIYNNAKQSIVCCFTPDFTPSVGSTKYLWDSSDSSRYFCAKDSGGTLDIYMGNTSIATIAEATYTPYWNTHGLNVLVIAGTTANTDAWLNGFKILDADNTAWSGANPAVIYLGARFSVANYFDGEIFAFGTYAFKMTDIQMRDITSQLLLTYS